MIIFDEERSKFQNKVLVPVNQLPACVRIHQRQQLDRQHVTGDRQSDAALQG